MQSVRERIVCAQGLTFGPRFCEKFIPEVFLQVRYIVFAMDMVGKRPRSCDGWTTFDRTQDTVPASRYGIRSTFGSAGSSRPTELLIHCTAPFPATYPLAKQAVNKYPPVGASQSNISPAQKTPGKFLSIRSLFNDSNV